MNLFALPLYPSAAKAPGKSGDAKSQLSARQLFEVNKAKLSNSLKKFITDLETGGYADSQITMDGKDIKTWEQQSRFLDCLVYLQKNGYIKKGQIIYNTVVCTQAKYCDKCGTPLSGKNPIYCDC